MNRQSTVTHRYWAKTIQTEALDRLNAWQREFLLGILMRLDMGIAINDKQETALEELYEKMTS